MDGRSIDLEVLVLVPEAPVRSRSMRRAKPASRAAAALLAAGVAAAPIATEAATISRWWEGKLGEWTSGSWTTTRRATQTLTFTSCTHNWSYAWGTEARVDIDLIEVKDRMPDVRRAEWKYACNQSDQVMVSPVTNSTKLHFFFDPDGDIKVRTSGDMRIRHS